MKVLQLPPCGCLSALGRPRVVNEKILGQKLLRGTQQQKNVLDQSRQWWLVENSQGQKGFIPNNILESSNNGQLPGQSITLKPSSSPEEVKNWLKNKGFSKITVKSLGILTGGQLLELSPEDLKAVCPEEGGRVFIQINEVRSSLGI